MSTKDVVHSTGVSGHVNIAFAWAAICSGLLTMCSFTQVAGYWECDLAVFQLALNVSLVVKSILQT